MTAWHIGAAGSTGRSRHLDTPPRFAAVGRRVGAAQGRLCAVTAIACWLCGSVAAAEQRLDLGAWQAMPVFSDARVMPLDSFARDAAETICGRLSPRLELAGAAESPDAPQLTGARALFADGPRRFSSAELLLSWLAEPEKWEYVPFLTAEHEGLRAELLRLPMTGPDGQRLKYASPKQVENSPALHARLRQLAQQEREAQARNERFEPVGVDKKAKALYDAYTLFRLVTFDPRKPIVPQGRAYSLIVDTVHGWRELEPDLSQLRAMDNGGEVAALLDRANEQVARILDLARGEDLLPTAVEPPLRALQAAIAGLSQRYSTASKRLFADPPAWSEDQLRRARAGMKELAAKVAGLARTADEAALALYDNGHGLRVAPALDAAALEAGRKRAGGSQPWLALSLLLYGSDAALRPYPAANVAAVREAFAAVRAAYVDRAASERPERLRIATARLAAATRSLGEEVEPQRQALPIVQRDEALLALTAYPSADFARAELHYNRLDPFFWSWILNLLAVAGFGLSFGVLRRPMFWTGVAALVAGQLMSCYGFGLRTYITGWAPVTGMFETVVFVALVAAILGLWFALSPLFWPGLRMSWQAAAFPGTWEGRAGDTETPPPAVVRSAVFRAAVVVARIALGAAVFATLAWLPYRSEGPQTIISLLPRTDVGATMPSGMDVLTWLVGMAVLVSAVWYLPRLVVAGFGALPAVPHLWFHEGLRRPMEQVMHRKAFVVVGAAVAFVVAFIAYYSPLWPKEIGSLTPVLRDRFWLYIHVLTITASYGAGALAFGLGLISLGYFLFGRYRQYGAVPATLLTEHRPAGVVHPSGSARRPPEACAALGGFIYKATQVAVLLLAAGTILGGLWADVAWGRFWGWDAKEVWALISLMAYLAVLHGRYAGWFGHFGLAAGSVVGASAIVMAWYGVNYYLRSGLHTYAEGAGGQIYVFSFLFGTWAFLAAAGLRYAFEMRVADSSPRTQWPLPLSGDAADRSGETVEVN